MGIKLSEVVIMQNDLKTIADTAIMQNLLDDLKTIADTTTLLIAISIFGALL